ncbi:HlyD family efflux transporter periplasmic adaptor subunit [Dysgonomonas sp. Marseille-P4677]|uniref:efflux RND transporter periplasmic adaptor subunit n=1 Tax=Dysgonomonas sp. Marseille-P4677 TaxID=2364790 RepID=UPI0019149E99|nr:HlyD family efflux transporter periplasmic adaptor subunit [Dysgonomonas sp. Marseille-P4677]MBK5722219.1 HlyD family efflux transporter periplasmic adaptor subunit [Dysgonomonas sp. Marseille-P4677]
MDKQISHQVLKKRHRKLLISISSCVTVVIMVSYLLVSMFKPTIDRSKIVVSTVDQGPLNITVSASGKIVPLSEEIITSPVTSKILKIYKQAGELLTAADTIIQLDLTLTNADLEKMENDLEIKRANMESFRAKAEKEFFDLEKQIQIDEMKLQRTEVLLRNEHYLDSIGASTADKVKQTELDYSVQKLQLEQLKSRQEKQMNSSKADYKVMELDYNTALKNMSLMNKTVAEAQILSPQNATLVWVNNQIGSTVSQGERIAIISDLNNYKVDANISDNYAKKITTGNKAIIRIGQEILSGTVGNVIPSVENGMINFTVTLDDYNHERLRTGLKVDVYVIESMKEDILRLDNKSYYHGPGSYLLWILIRDKAFKKTVILGESSFEKVEIMEGLNKGDKVIISDMSKYKNDIQLTID